MTAFKDWLNGLTSKTTPVDADELYVRDSSGTPGSKKLTWANLVATLKTAFNSLTLTGGTATASSPVLTTTQTWNNAGVTFVGKSTNITNTASSSSSSVEDWQVDGTTIVRIRVDHIFCPTGIQIMADRPLAWSKSNAIGANVGYHVTLYREGDGIIAQRLSTNAQTSRLYGTYTDASNYRRLTKTMSTAGVAEIKPEGAGTGASGNVLHISGLPTSNPGAGILWNDGGTVKVGT